MERIQELDILKAFAIIMVLIGHANCPQYLYHVVYLVHVPLFFMVSGCTSRDDESYYNANNVKQFIKKRVKTLYIPFLKYSIPIVLLHNIFTWVGFNNHYYTLVEYLKQLLRTLLFSIGKEPLLDQLWFIKVLFLAEVYYTTIVYITYRMKINKWLILFPLIFISTMVPSEVFPKIFETNLLWPFKAIFFYVLGRILMKKFNYARKKLKNYIYWLIFIAWLISPLFFHSSFHDGFGLMFFVIVAFTIAVGLLLIKIGNLLKQYTRPNIIYAILMIGGSTMPIYCLHNVVFKILSYIYLKLSNGPIEILATTKCISSLHWTIYVIFGIIIPLLLKHFFDRVVNHK